VLFYHFLYYLSLKAKSTKKYLIIFYYIKGEVYEIDRFGFNTDFYRVFAICKKNRRPSGFVCEEVCGLPQDGKTQNKRAKEAYGGSCY
jgi:hypothetical protein